MRIISKKVLNQFFERQPKSKQAFLQWYLKVKQSDWSNFGELKLTFPSADYVGNDLYVFNVGGTKYRLIARVFFKARMVYIRFVGTHQDYDKVKLANL